MPDAVEMKALTSSLGSSHCPVVECWLPTERGHNIRQISLLWLKKNSREVFSCEPSAANTPGNFGNECLGPERGPGFCTRASTVISPTLISITAIPFKLVSYLQFCLSSIYFLYSSPCYLYKTQFLSCCYGLQLFNGSSCLNTLVWLPRPFMI